MMKIDTRGRYSVDPLNCPASPLDPNERAALRRRGCVAHRSCEPVGSVRGGTEGVFCPQPALHLTPPRLARVEQSQIDRRYAKNPDHGRLGRSLPDTVIMWRVRDPPDEASGRYRNGGIGVEVATAVHPPCA